MFEFAPSIATGIGLVAAAIGLSAACGFRIFLPLAMLSAIAQFGDIGMTDGFASTFLNNFELPANYAWVAKPWAFGLFTTATIIEIAAYYIPWVDNLLDTVATPAAVVAGAFASMAIVGDMHPGIAWTTAAIAGGTAGGVQTGTVVTRAISTEATGGFGNFVVSTVEMVSAFVMSLLALIIPILALVVVMFLILGVVRRLVGRRSSTSEMQRSTS